MTSAVFELRSFLRQRHEAAFLWNKSVKSRNVDIFALNGPKRPPVLEVTAADTADDFTSYEPGETYRRTLPEIHNLAAWQYEELLEHFRAGPVQAPGCAIATFRNASVLHPGTIMTAQGHVVSESLRNTYEIHDFSPFVRLGPEAALHLELPRRSVQPRLKGPHVMLRQACDANYGHWLVESLSQAHLAVRELGAKGLKFIVSMHNPAMDRVYRETLAYLGIDESQIVPVPWEPIHVDELIFPLPLAKHQYVKSPLVIRMLESFVDIAAAKTAPKRLYVSRNAYSKRRLMNEADVLAICERHGFVVVYPEQMSFAEQVRTFSAAEIVVGSCGAALTNIAFCPRGGAVLALANEVMPDGFFWDLADLKGFRYVSLHGRSVPTELDDNDWGFDPKLAPFFRRMDEDFVIDPQEFSAVLDRILAGGQP